MATIDAPATARAFPAGAFRRMGWAFLFLAISIGPTVRLDREMFFIDALPDFVGYLMIATGANRLVPYCRRARGVRNLALLLAYLSIPTTVQYMVVTSQSGNVGTWQTPLWALAIVPGLLDLVLIWMLCGLVAGLARRAGDEAVEQRARVRRVVYVFLSALLTGGLVFVLTSPERDLIVPLVITGVVVGLVLLGLMMGLMRRAERMVEQSPESALMSSESGDLAPSGGWVYRLLALGGVLLPIALVIGAHLYYYQWGRAREEAWRYGERFENYQPIRQEFLAHLLAGRIDAAYESTTADFKSRISREQLAELARRYVAYVNLPDVRGGGNGSSGPVAGDRGWLRSQRVEYREHTTLWDGKTIQVTTTVRRDRDSILFPKPPPLKMDDFKVEEMAAPQHPWPGFGRPRGPGL